MVPAISKAEIDAAIGRLEDLFDAVGIAGVEGVGSAELTGQRQFIVVDVDGDDAAGPRDDGTEHARQADAAEADDSDHVTGLGLGRVDRGTDAGDDGTAEQGGILERHVLGDLLHRVARHDGVLGEAGEAGVVGDLLALELQAAAAGGEITALLGGVVGGAQIGTRVVALPAIAAARREDEDDVVADLDVRDAVSERGDLASAFMAEHRWQRARAGVVDGREVGMAQARRAHLDQHLARSRRIELQRLDFEGLALSVRAGQALLIKDGATNLHCKCLVDGMGGGLPAQAGLGRDGGMGHVGEEFAQHRVIERAAFCDMQGAGDEH